MRWMLSGVLACFAVVGMAKDVPIRVVGQETVEITMPAMTRGIDERATLKKLTFPKIQLSDKAKTNLKAKLANLDKPRLMAKPDLPKSVQLGMNDVPVLNQAEHGSCVTFAVTAAIDAILGQGDYVSQYCNLSLGRWLFEAGHAPYSGWDGSFAEYVLAQIADHGIVNKSKQYQGVCAGVTEYPIDTASNAHLYTTEPSVFAEHGEAFFNTHSFAAIFDAGWALLTPNEAELALTKVKRALNDGKRVLIGTLVPIQFGGVAGALGSYVNTFDTWVLTPSIRRAIENDQVEYGHEMIITGFDDRAKTKNVKQKPGLLKLRNSWDVNVGDHGEFYMSYDFFKVLAVDSYVIID